MSLRRSAGTVAGVLTLLALAAPAAGAAVTVRIEGANGAKVAIAEATLPAPAVQKTVNCAADSAGAVLERVVAGQWGGGSFGGTQLLETIQGETHTFESGRYWRIFRNDKESDDGVCETKLQDGDEVLFYVACFDAQTGCYADGVLAAQAPARVRPGEPFTVAVRATNRTFEGPNFEPKVSEGPSPGAQVAAASGERAVADAEGRAVLALSARGETTLRVTNGSRAPDTLPVCVTDGRDGACGTTRCETSGDDGRCGTVDVRPPTPVLIGFEDGERYALADLERLISGGVTSDPSGIRSLELSIARRSGRRCAVYSGRRERFLRASCSKRSYFTLGSAAAFDYLLPKRLTRGRYEIALRATDAAGNAATTRARFSAR